MDRFGQVYNRQRRHHVTRATTIRPRSATDGLISIHTTSAAAAAAARWLLPGATPTCGRGSHRSTWADGGYLLPAVDSAAAVSAAAGRRAAGAGGREKARRVVRNDNHPVLLGLLVLWMSRWTRRLYLRR